MQRLNKHPLQYRLQIQVRPLEEELQSQPESVKNGSTKEDKPEEPEGTTEDAERTPEENDAEPHAGENDQENEEPAKDRPRPDSQLSKEELMDKYRVYNSCLEWDNEQYPWLDLAIITITTPMSEEHLRKTKFLLTNQVESFSPALPVSTKGFRSLLLVTKEFHGIGEYQPKEVSKYNVPVENTTKYKIAVVTGKVMDAGTDADVYITIAGEPNCTIYFMHIPEFDNDKACQG